MSNPTFTKTTAKGAVLVVTLDGLTLTATVDGAPISSTLKILDAPKTVGTKVVIAQIGAIGLTREEYEAICALYPAPPVVAPEHQHAESYSREAQAFDRGFVRRHTDE